MGAGDIFKGTVDVEYERDWSFGLDTTSGNRHKRYEKSKGYQHGGEDSGFD